VLLKAEKNDEVSCCIRTVMEILSVDRSTDRSVPSVHTSVDWIPLTFCLTGLDLSLYSWEDHEV
jgi:hypothetical protein